MNYRLAKTYIVIKERQGIIENNSSGVVQFATVVKGVDPNNSNNTEVINPSGKYVFRLKENEVLYARVVNRLTAEINVLYIPDDPNDLDMTEVNQKIEELKGEIPSKLSELDNDMSMSIEDAESIIKKYK